MRLLLVEDDEQLGDGLQVGLTQSGYTVDWIKDGHAAEEYLNADIYVLMILDIGLPGRSGLDVLKALRSRGSVMPVLLLTARDTIEDKVTGLDAGADDYLVKPFDLDEVTARIRALLRRRSGRSNPVIHYREILLDPASRTVTLGGLPVEITPREFSVLLQLLENQGRVLSRAQLEQGLYSWNDDVDSNTIEVYIHHLRRKLGTDIIRTMRGVGYVIKKNS